MWTGEPLQSILFDLNQLIPIINHWFHLMSAVIWIGGLAFLVMAVTPALQKSVPKEYIRPILDAFYARYRTIVGGLMAIILVTGGINLHYINQMMKVQTQTDGISQNPKYLMILFIKLSLVLAIVTIFLYTIIFKNEPDEPEGDEVHEPVPFQRVALWMGIFIILCAAALKYLHF